MDRAAFEAAGLYDPSSPRGADRLQLLTYLSRQGVSLEEMVEADQRGRLAALPMDRSLKLSGNLTFAQAAAEAGLSEPAAARAHQAVGLPVMARATQLFGPEDVEMLRVFAQAEAVFGEEVTLQLARVIGLSASRIAEAEVSAFLLNVAAPLAAEGTGENTMARANADMAAMVPAVSRVLDLLHRRHLEVAIRTFNISPNDPTTTPTFDLGVGFADLVGFTGLSQSLSTRELAAAIADFEGRTAEIVASAGGRMVKLIGDEVMYVSEAAGPAVEVMAALLREFDGVDRRLPPLRGGVTCGEVLARDGDYFGPVVNLANRAVKLARPGAALVSREVREAVGDAPDGFRFGASHLRRIKGFDRRVPMHSLRPERRPRALPRLLAEATAAATSPGRP